MISISHITFSKKVIWYPYHISISYHLLYKKHTDNYNIASTTKTTNTSTTSNNDKDNNNDNDHKINKCNTKYIVNMNSFFIENKGNLWDITTH